MTEIAYVLSPDWDHYLFTSLHTLFQSGSTFDRVRIYCVGKKPGRWDFDDPRIIVQEVSPLSEAYFLINKTYLTQSDAERVIFLDADTLVLGSLDNIWKRSDADFIGRVAVGYYKDKWNQHQWKRALHSVGAESTTPYFNSGFVIFQNGAHRQIGSSWRQSTRELMKGGLPDPGVLKDTIKYAEQVGLSLAIASANLSFDELSSTDHAFGWGSGDPYEEAIVYHTGGPSFFLHTLLIDRTMNLQLDAGFLGSQPSSIRARIRRQLWYERFKLVAKRILQPLGLTSSARALLHRARSLLST